MKNVGLFSLTLAMACAEAPDGALGEAPIEPVFEEECKVGFKVGRCPADFSLPDRDGELVGYTDYAGQRVAVVGAAGW
jgi:hypothetical protein